LEYGRREKLLAEAELDKAIRLEAASGIARVRRSAFRRSNTSGMVRSHRPGHILARRVGHPSRRPTRYASLVLPGLGT
jgi:hypothetical protein